MLLGFSHEVESPAGCNCLLGALAIVGVPGLAFWWFARDSQWIQAVAFAVIALLGGFLLFGVQLDREARKSFERVWKQKLRQFLEDEGLSKSDLLVVAKEKLAENGAAMKFLGEL
jgi:ABC-type nickel/cobalt efflux system permease component RcnA